MTYLVISSLISTNFTSGVAQQFLQHIPKMFSSNYVKKNFPVFPWKFFQDFPGNTSMNSTEVLRDFFSKISLRTYNLSGIITTDIFFSEKHPAFSWEFLQEFLNPFLQEFLGNSCKTCVGVPVGIPR